MRHKIPDWLKTDPVVCHVPDRTIFAPQRRIVNYNGQPHLLDCCGNRYPLAQCDRLRREHLSGVALWITEGLPLTVFRLTAKGDEIAVTDGKKRAIVQLQPSCFYCGSLATLFCDGKTETGTCDRPMCDRCVGKQSVFIACSRRPKRAHTGTVDYCPECQEKRAASLERLVSKAEGRVNAT